MKKKTAKKPLDRETVLKSIKELERIMHIVPYDELIIDLMDKGFPESIVESVIKQLRRNKKIRIRKEKITLSYIELAKPKK